jgi:hypothetical protein
VVSALGAAIGQVLRKNQMKLLGGLQQRSLFFIPRHEGGKCHQVRGPLLTCHRIHKLTVQVRQARSLRPVIYLGQVSMFLGKTQNEQCGITGLKRHQVLRAGEATAIHPPADR